MFPLGQLLLPDLLHPPYPNNLFFFLPLEKTHTQNEKIIQDEKIKQTKN